MWRTFGETEVTEPAWKCRQEQDAKCHMVVAHTGPWLQDNHHWESSSTDPKHLLLRPQHQSKLQSSPLCWPQPSASCHHIFSTLCPLICHTHTSLNILLSFLQKSSRYPHYFGDAAFLLQ